jgi:hypothetical protein
VTPDNALWQAQERIGKAIESSLDAYRDMRDRSLEAAFHAMYGSPLVQALVGLKASDASPRRRPGVDAVYRAFVAQRIAELTQNITQGGPREAAIRALFYIRLPEGVADERGFRLLERIRSPPSRQWSATSSIRFCSMSAARSKLFRPCSTRTLTLPRAWEVPCAS